MEAGLNTCLHCSHLLAHSALAAHGDRLQQPKVALVGAARAACLPARSAGSYITYQLLFACRTVLYYVVFIIGSRRTKQRAKHSALQPDFRLDSRAIFLRPRCRSGARGVFIKPTDAGAASQRAQRGRSRPPEDCTDWQAGLQAALPLPQPATGQIRARPCQRRRAAL